MEFKGFSLIPKTNIKNTYIFETIDENDNIIDKQIFTNVAMSKRYFSANANSLRLVLGTMLPDDYSKYQKDGKWLKGWAVKYDKDGNESHNTNDTWGVDETFPGTDKKLYSFKGRVDENDTGLWGTAVKEFNLNWEWENYDSNIVTLKSQVYWEYHSPSSPFNTIQTGGDARAEVAGTRGNNISGIPESTTDWGNPTTNGMYDENNSAIDPGVYTRTPYKFNHETSLWGVAKEEQAQVKYSSTIFGIAITDAGFFGNGGMLSHFKTKTTKRPTDKLRITIKVQFSITNAQLSGSFIPEGNLNFGNGINSPYKGTVQYKPNYMIFSGYPIRQCAGGSLGNGIVPIPPYGMRVELKEALTDKPNDWIDDEKGYWFGFPQYKYFCKGEIYKKITEKIKDGVDEEGNDKYKDKTSYYLNDKEQKVFDWNNTENKTVQKLNSINFGPVRSVIMEGFSAKDAPRELIPGVIEGIRIGTGDGVTTKFFHPFTSETGEVYRGYCVQDNPPHIKEISRYYDYTRNPLSQLVGIYDSYGNLLCDGGLMNKIYENYDKTNKYCHFGLDPFTLNYYPYGSNILGASEWLVYICTSEIKSGWIGMNVGKDIRSSLTLRTAPTIEELFDNRTAQIAFIGDYGPNAHDQTTLENFKGLGYVAVQGGNGWRVGGYMGGLWYDTYDRSGIRLSTEEKVTGYIEFDAPPRAGALIYIDAEIKVPFVHYFNGFSANICYSFGEEEDNGTEVVDLNDIRNW